MKWGLLIAPPVLALVFIALPLIDAVSPWSVAESELDNYGRGGIAICVGMSYTASGKDSETQRSYLLLGKRELVTIAETHQNGNNAVNLTVSKWGFWLILTIFLILVWFSCRVSIPRIAKKLKRNKIKPDYRQPDSEKLEASANVSGEDMSAHYNDLLECWEFRWEGFDFHIQGNSFNREALHWAREIVSVIRRRKPQIYHQVMEYLKNWACDKAKAEILSINLDDYAEHETFVIAITGDDSWGDLGVDVTITKGEIIAIDGGD